MYEKKKKTKNLQQNRPRRAEIDRKQNKKEKKFKKNNWDYNWASGSAERKRAKKKIKINKAHL
jgi:hypothetical protein